MVTDCYTTSGDTIEERVLAHVRKVKKTEVLTIAKALRWREGRVFKALEGLAKRRKVRWNKQSGVIVPLRPNLPQRPPKQCENCGGGDYKRLKKGSRHWQCQYCQTVAKGIARKRKPKATQTEIPTANPRAHEAAKES